MTKVKNYPEATSHELELVVKKVTSTVAVCNMVTSYGIAVEVMIKGKDFEELDALGFFCARDEKGARKTKLFKSSAATTTG